MSDEPASDPPPQRPDDTASIRRTQADHERRLRAVEGWPQRVVVAVVGGALGMCITVAGSAWVLSAQLARTEVAVESASDRIARVEARLDRLEERAWQRTDTSGRRRTEDER